jgi:hypothetical protein
MSDVSAMRITVGDKIGVYDHLPGTTKTFEDVVSGVNATTKRGRGFIVDVSADVLG